MNPIEQIWNEHGRQEKQHHQINTLNTLRTALILEWNNILNAVVLRHVSSMRHQIQVLITASGGHTREELW